MDVSLWTLDEPGIASFMYGEPALTGRKVLVLWSNLQRLEKAAEQMRRRLLAKQASVDVTVPTKRKLLRLPTKKLKKAIESLELTVAKSRRR